MSLVSYDAAVPVGIFFASLEVNRDSLDYSARLPRKASLVTAQSGLSYSYTAPVLACAHII